MSPPVITWFFNPALALWPSPHDEAEATGGIEGAIVRILNGHPPFALRKGRDFPSGLHGGVSINAPHPNTTATSSLVTRFVVRVALDIDKACDGHRRGPPGAVAFTFRLGQSLLARHVDSRPQTLVYKLVIAASKKVVRTARFDAAMSLGASSDGCRLGRLFLFVLQIWYESQADRDGGIRMDGQDGKVEVWLAGQV